MPHVGAFGSCASSIWSLLAEQRTAATMRNSAQPHPELDTVAQIVPGE